MFILLTSYFPAGCTPVMIHEGGCIEWESLSLANIQTSSLDECADKCLAIPECDNILLGENMFYTWNWDHWALIGFK